MTPAPPILPEGIPRAIAWRVLGQSLWQVDLADGSAAVVKRTPYRAEMEADGLEALRDAGAPVPSVMAVAQHLLVLEHVSGPPDWAGLGATLATVHRRSADRFGWGRANALGPLPQPNPWTDDWAEFYAEQRLRPHVDAPGVPPEARRRLHAGIDGPLAELLGTPPPSLIHGDLWSGNVVGGRWLIDPAVCYADREHELAFMEVFGGFPPAMFDAYERAWPLSEGWRRRRPALQLYHLLVHVRLFGPGYVPAVISRLDSLGW
ncbi:MAG TPA: fructosamine kinase family protein [Egibacteraceae bacterium]|nr:fructosamine kinase family protein [Egibacteraceae bacterium]